MILIAFGFTTFIFWKYNEAGLGKIHLASIQLNGLIYHDKEKVLAIEKARDDPSVLALLVEINSPGGTVVGGETLYESIRYFADKKPAVAIMGDLATSAGYMTAIATDKIYAQKATITGSIGVLFQTAEVTELLAKIGINVETVKSSPLKGSPNLLEKVTPAARNSTKLIVNDISDMFIRMVADRRGISIDQARNLSDGRVYTGQMALKQGLIDAIGGRREAINWLEIERNIPNDLPIIPLRSKKSESKWLERLQGLTQKIFFSERSKLDGLLSIWQPLKN
ncbi:MAG: signal peptide peptidase SppA [Alphaproteobacteria bacterium]